MKVGTFGIPAASVRGDRDRLPRDVFFIKNGRKDTSGGLNGQPQCSSQELAHGNGLEVQKVKPSMTLRDLRHVGHGGSGVREQDVPSEFKEAQDRPLLFFFV